MWVGNERVDHATEHPAFHRAAHALAGGFDLQYQEAYDCLMPGAANMVNFQGTGVNAEQRVRIFRLAWDFAASGLGSRNEQYERFYLGSAGRNFTNAHLYNDRTRGDRLVKRFLVEDYDSQ